MSSDVGHKFLSVKGIQREENTSDFLVRCVCVISMNMACIFFLPNIYQNLPCVIPLLLRKSTVKLYPCTGTEALYGRTTHRGSRGIALPFHDHDTRRGRGDSITPWPLFAPRKDAGALCTGDWVGPRAGLDRCAKSRPHRVSITGRSIP